ncbi:MAG TPA: sulfotransferase [Acidimicrobiales bacterium]|jgi:hypothetical protein|nr:sulfotransferase [Acidimicrobiales bacterium]
MTWRTALADGLHGLSPRAHLVFPSEQRTDLRHRLGRYRRWEDGVDLSPPLRRAGEMIGPPDFVGIGVMMAGVRWWYHLVADHPGISTRGGIPMDRHFLSHFATRSFGAEQVAQYHGWFPRRPGTITGEWSPSYAALPWVAELLARAAPDARLLLLLRNPIERFRLGLAQSSENRGSQVGTHVADAMERGFYGAQLGRVLEFFPAGQVLVLQHECCVADPVAQLALTYRFLGLDDSHRPPRIGPRNVEAERSIPTADPDAVRRLVGVYAGDVKELAAMVPSLDLSWWPEFADG